MLRQKTDPVLYVTLDLRPSLHELMRAASVAWVTAAHKEKFLAHDWPIHDERALSTSLIMTSRSYALVTPDDLAGCAGPILRALLTGRSVWPGTLHEALALAARRYTLKWWNHDFAVVGTRVNGYTPTVATRGSEIYLGAERLPPYDPPSHFMVSF